MKVTLDPHAAPRVATDTALVVRLRLRTELAGLSARYRGRDTLEIEKAVRDVWRRVAGAEIGPAQLADVTAEIQRGEAPDVVIAAG
ncbi:hypothetical protein [Actinoalloteichus spitiensis]|uniref:hypothetical protein n=1 Tax=Actinoalloteichus spitiensis TaxID=252394 RepID=UPI00036B8C8F|nr:hypothetical protein [Actinoalloteichus spitiensis]